METPAKCRCTNFRNIYISISISITAWLWHQQNPLQSSRLPPGLLHAALGGHAGRWRRATCRTSLCGVTLARSLSPESLPVSLKRCTSPTAASPHFQSDEIKREKQTGVPLGPSVCSRGRRWVGVIGCIHIAVMLLCHWDPHAAMVWSPGSCKASNFGQS